ncbi:MAG: beta-propeller domain-containing protein, partial [Jatrophihabitans sp.]
SLAGRRRTRRRAWLVTGGVATGGLVAAAVVLVLALQAGTTGSQPGARVNGAGAPAPAAPVIRPASLLLSSYHSCSDLLNGLRSHTAASVTADGLPGQQLPFVRNSMSLPKASVAASASAGDAATSTTNDQESGVDEPDLVKTDQDRLISITGGVLRVLDARSKKVTGTIDLSLYDGWRDAQLLVAGDHALVLLGGSSSSSAFDSLPAAGTLPGGRSSYLFIDLSGQPRVTGSLRPSGSYLDARLVGSTVRLVVRSGPAISFPVTAQSIAANQRIVRQAPLAAWLPQYSISTGTTSTQHSVPCGQVSHPSQYTGASLLTVYTIDLADPAADPKPISVAADGNTVYATAGNLYIASNPDWYCCPTAAGAQRTEIHRFDIAGTGQPRYLGSGSVPGRLLSQYSLSEYADSLRVATTTGGSGGVGPAAESSGVYVLDADTLKATGTLVGLGKNEQIYAVRFVGPVAYLVTFRQTDPLYVIDLHDRAAPRLSGSLQLTGYSNYLHDAGDSRVIGVGQEASAAGRVAGLQVSLFDVSTPSRPRRTGHVVRSDAPGESDLDPHAFLYWQPTGLVVVPIQSWSATQSGKVLVLTVHGTTLSTVGLLANPRTAGISDDGLGIQRSVLVDGALWTVSGSGVLVSSPATLARQAWIPFG